MTPDYRAAQLVYLLAIGTSLTNAYAMPSQTFGYCRFVSDKLGGRSWLNKGVNGQSTTSILGRYGVDVYPNSPSIVIVEGGTNDYGTPNNIDSATSIQNLKDMIEGCLSNGVLLVVWLPIMLDLNWSAPEQANAETINDAVSAWVVANHSSNVIEVNTDQIVTDGKTIDGQHLSAKGYEDMGEIIGDAILNF